MNLFPPLSATRLWSAPGRGLLCLLASLALLGTLVSSSVAARADRDEDRGDQLLLVPDTERAQRALKRTRAEVVVAYEAFDLVLASGDDARKLKQAGADRREDMRTVALAGGEEDPTEDGQDDLEQGEPAKRGLALVQFVGPIKEGWRGRLRGDGVKLVSYVPQNAYVVSGRRRQLQRLADRAAEDRTIRAVTAYEAQDKVSEDVEETSTVAVHTLAGPDGEEARRATRRRGRAQRPEAEVGPYRTLYVSLDDEDAAAELAEDPGVVAVGSYRPPELRDERASQIAAGNLSGGQPVLGPGYLAWLTSKGFTPSGTLPFAIDVTDEGLDNGKLSPKHPDLHRDGLAASPSRVVYLNNYTSDDGKRQHRDCSGHGTINASIAGGYNTATNSGDQPYEDTADFNYGLGVAPRALLGSSKIFRCRDGRFSARGGFTRLTSAAYAKGARISNNSWGADVYGEYTLDSYEYDSLVRDAQPAVAGNQEMVEVFAAGNIDYDPGSIASPATAKNVIAVGASENVRPAGTDGCRTPDAEANDAREITSFSSRGPTDDGRIKPDLVAPGTHVTGAAPQHGAYTGDGVCNRTFPPGNTLYSLSTGTSHSTPVVAGAAALVRDFYTRTQGSAPSAAMTKALLINGATDVAGSSNNGSGAATTSAPNNDQGWGLVNLGRTLDSTGRSHLDQTSLLTTTGAAFSRSYSVVDPTRPVEITLVWTDAPGFLSPGNSFVNDLNLQVTRNSNTYKGNVFANGVSAPNTGSADPANNVESIVLPAGTIGSFSLQVVAANLAADGVPGTGDSTDQDFALVVANATPGS